jgi:hypothetical protein
MSMMPSIRNYVILPIVACASLLPGADAGLAKTKSAADEKFFLQVLKECRWRSPNLVRVQVNYEKRTFKCIEPASKKRNKNRY